MGKQNKMGTTPIFKLIVTMSLPAMFSMLIQSLYNIVDSMFVAQIGEEALTAVSLAFPIQMLIIAVAVGTGIGINSLVSRKLGERRKDEASKAATHGILLGVFSWMVFALFGVFFSKTFFSMFTTNPIVYEMGYNYLSIVTIFSFGIFVEINLEKTLQATGNMIYPMVFQLIGAVINIILDPIFIFGLFGVPAFGVKGAAIATVLGQIISMIFAMYIVFTKNHDVHISFKNFKFSGRTVKNIYSVGFPSIVMQSISSVLVIGLNSILISFSESAVSVLGVYYKLQSFVFMPVFGLTQGIMPIMGYNFGARDKNRIIDALKIGLYIALIIMMCGTALFSLIPNKLLMIFNASPEMLSIGVPALRIISICFIPAAVGILLSTLFQAVGSGMNSLIVSVLRQLVIILPSAYILSKIGLTYVWLAFPIAEVAASIVSACMFIKLYKEQLRDLKPVSYKDEAAN
ncbi:MATE family efflux transporter [Clostridium cadaveris]|uniref:Probable multidrug resistance protein NorM n=1 Tax=Clostridium cadaveris TaxID=1529 RepID=A0A1I2M5Q0_9CLOT|nr:MATE family efflux transporter [Clostridium cadaveris]MDM8312418.1 MATE family efflux transporter [Clostridium cadaveris]MDY4948579.1 MATE family efflux transporter [Clostridium cadaveris]NME63670.1 MATE family efflux transporter [Clostridium cadaveris]NWK12768.1 MATE family efflux transporter [Clostridium cadaveris]SFF84877.1 putative efflux protein, MATE family [Clostridium cadaveris]